MRDLRRIKKQLWWALALPIAGSGCAREGGSVNEPVATPRSSDAATMAAPVADAAPVAVATPDAAPVPERPPDMRMPSCPSGAYCSTVAATRKVAKKGAELVERCVVQLDKPPDPPPEGLGAGAATYVVSTLDQEKTKAQREAGEKDACCYTWVMPCPGGRPLLVAEGSRVAPVRPGSSWSVPVGAVASDIDDALRAALSSAWRADALAEHASIASFARAALELMAVGAPPELLADVQRAALDEIEHARLCFTLAARYGESVEPGPLPAAMPRDGGLVVLARNTLREGCMGESVAALAVARMRAACRDVDVLSALRKIGRDEERHAALAWRTLSWAIKEGGTPVVVGLQAEWDVILAEEKLASVEGEDDPRLAEHGRLGVVAQARVRREAIEQLIGPTLSALLVG